MMLKKLLKNEEGSYVIMVALFLSFLLGFSGLVVDVGRIYAERQRLYNSLDAGALAGVQGKVLGQTDWEDQAGDYITENLNKSIQSYLVKSIDASTVEASGTMKVEMSLLRIFGYDEITIKGSVQAVAGTLSAAKGVLPIAIVDDRVFTKDVSYPLTATTPSTKEADLIATSGNFGFLDIDTSGARGLAAIIRSGGASLSVDSSWPTEPGNKIKSDGVDEALKLWIGKEAIIPMIEGLPNGKGPVKIVGFAAFVIEGISDDDQLIGKFVSKIKTGEIGAAKDFGVKVVRLID